jgi:heme exporter protein B
MKQTLFLGILKRELLISYRRRSELIQPLVFFVVIVFLFPFAASYRIAFLMPAAIIWLAALLATFLASEYLFRIDFEEGVLEQFVLSSYPISLYVIAKVLAHWLVTSLPLLLITPLLGWVLNLPMHVIFIVVVSLLIGTPTLNMIGAIGNALTIGLKQSFLLGIIVLPLYIPVLIFGSVSITLAIGNNSVNASLAMLGALFLLSFTLAPLAVASALKAGI